MKKITRMACVLAIAALAVAGLGGCGKKEAKEEYEYTASFKQSTLRYNGMYMSCEYTEGDTYYGIENVFDGNEETFEGTYRYVLHAADIVTGEEKTTELESPGEVKDNQGNTYSNASFYAIRPSGDKLYALLGKWDEQTYETEYLLRVYGSDGKQVKEISIQQYVGDGYINSDTLQVTKDGKILFSNGSSIICVDENGKQLFSINAGYHIPYLIKDKDDNVYCAYYGDGGESVSKVNLSNGTLGETVAANDVDYLFADGNLIFISTSTSVREVDIVTKETKPLWGWLDVDINDTGIQRISKNEDGTYSVVSVSAEEEKKLTFETATVSYGPAGADAKKKLVFGCVSLDWDVRDAIRNFNKTNDEYRISVKCYTDEFPDWEAAYDKFKMDLSAGNKFDLLCTDGSELQTYIDSKALADLTGYFDRDFKREDFFTKALDAFSRDGKLYAVSPTFSLQTMVVSDKVAAGRTSWTLDDIMELRRQNPDITFMEAGNRETALTMMLYYSLDDFIDYKKGECNFDSDRFKTLLEFAMTFPEEFNYDEFDEWQAISDGDILMTIAYISDLDLSDIQIYNKLFNGKTVLIGFPTDSGVGNRISTGSAYAVSSKSKYKEGAWEFLKVLYSDEYQRDTWNFPIVKKIYEEKVEEHINPTDRGFGGSAIGNGYQVIELGQPTRAEYDLVEAAIENSTSSLFYDENVFEMVREETAPFFKGQKSADEVADLIQKRVRLYLQEKK